MFTLDISGFDELTDALTKYQETVTEGVKDALVKSANDIADAAKANTSGALSDAISTEISDDGLSATITAGSPDAVSAEYGIPKAKSEKHEHKEAQHHNHTEGKHKEHTPHHKDHHKIPKPFLNPAFEENKQALLDSIAQTLQGQ